MIYLIRHGQTDQNARKLLQGRSNAPLNEEGRRQARQLSDYFKKQNIRIDAVYSSPLQRAVETAVLTAGDNIPIRLDDRLLEMDYGPYEGIPLDPLPEEILYFFQDFVHHPAPDGMESLDSVKARLGSFLAGIQEENVQNLLISTHAIAMKGALEYLTPESKGAYWSKYIPNAAVYCFDYQKGHFTVPKELIAK